MFLPKIYPITDVRTAQLSHREQVEKFVQGGAQFVQLRDKYTAPRDFYADAEEALKFARKNNVKLIINDRVDIALALRADGVHLGQDDFPPQEARKVLGAKAIIGFSTHNLEQAIEAIKLPIDYIAIGPVFTTKTKENPDPTVGIEALKKIRAAIGNFPLVAIGGINSNNFQAVLAAGADSTAIISDLLSNPEKIAEKFKLLLAVCKT